MKVEILLLIVLFHFNSVHGKCIAMRFDSDSIVCVCNSTFCDSAPKITSKIPKGKYIIYSSTASGLRFYRQENTFETCNYNSFDISINHKVINSNETILGFGGSITDSVGENFQNLKKKTQIQLLMSYYSKQGIEYSMGRIPIGATDFSKGPYSYAEIKDDFELKYFKLKFEDYQLKIPILRKALEINPNLLLIASPWTCPYWMKTNDNYAFVGVLKPEHYQTYANYYMKFLEAYKTEGVKIWAITSITTGNEPSNGFLPFPLPTLGWRTQDVILWIKNNLGPTIRQSDKFNLTKLIIHDDQKFFLPRLTRFFRDDETLKFIDGVGVHWYLNSITPKSFLNYAKTPKKALFILGTEATNGFLQFPSVELGSWTRAEKYADDIFDDLEFGAAGWIDWNIALDMYGGPVYTNFNADATIIINAQADEFYKQPTYYIMGHFSKFLPRGSVRISVVNYNRNIRVLAYITPEGKTSVIIHNKSLNNFNIIIRDVINGCARIKLRARSINSLIY